MHEVDIKKIEKGKKRGRILEYITLSWNIVEAIISIIAGALAGSIALVGFGIDSVIESISGGVMLWRLKEGADAEKREAVALKLVGVSFIILALYVSYEAVTTLVYSELPEESIVGIVIAALSLLVMPLLAYEKRKVASAINSRAMKADSRQTDLCAYLSAILLVGLLLNAWLGWWWADPVAGLIMVPIISKEGYDALKGKQCDCHS